jgi:hypothetical protein
MLIAISEAISLLKQNDWNEKYHIELEINEPLSFYDWKGEVAMRAVYSCVCILLTFGFVMNN